MRYRSYASPAYTYIISKLVVPFTSVMSPSCVTGLKSRKRKSSRSWYGVTMAASWSCRANLSGRIHAGIFASGRYLLSTTKSLESVPAELGHLPPEVDKRDEGFIGRRKGERRADSLLFLTSEVSLLVLTSEKKRKRGGKKSGPFPFWD